MTQTQYLFKSKSVNETIRTQTPKPTKAISTLNSTTGSLFPFFVSQEIKKKKLKENYSVHFSSFLSNNKIKCSLVFIRKKGALNKQTKKLISFIPSVC